MRICIPITEDRGLESPVSAHFGSAPLFMVVDTESGQHRSIANRNEHHEHGRCQPLSSLQGEQIDGMVVGGIGRGALYRLLDAGIRVFLSDHPTVEHAVAACKAGTLRPVTPETACSHHGHGHHGPQGDR